VEIQDSKASSRETTTLSKHLIRTHSSAGTLGCKTGSYTDAYSKNGKVLNSIKFNYLLIYVPTQQPKGQLLSKYEPKKETKQTQTNKRATNRGRNLLSFRRLQEFRKCKTENIMC
jgi:hypothetical protein